MINHTGSRTKSGASARTFSAILIAVLLVAASVAFSLPTNKAAAQGVTIITSADSHGGTFFGNAALQVVVDDPDADDDDLQEDITVDISANPDVGTGDSGSFTIFETNRSSSRFEFFLAHADSTVLASELDAINVNGAQEHEAISVAPNSHEASIIRFGASEEIGITSGILEDVSFDITVGDEEIAVDYEESSAVLELDRSTYGSDSLVHMFMVDQDGNLNPTEADQFTASAADLNTLLFEVVGGSFADQVTFEETGDNTARFEGILALTSVPTGSDDEFVFESEAVELTLYDIADYQTPADITLSTDTSSKSFDIDDEDGEIDDITTLTFSSELQLTLRDNDRNRDSNDDETLDDVVTVSVDTSGGDVEVLDMAETDDNTGVFEIDLANSELRVTFLDDGDDPSPNNGVLELRESDITEDIVIEYNDTRDDDSAISITSSQTIEMTLASGVINLPESAGISDSFPMTLTEADLNDNPRTKDSYSFILNGAGPYELMRAGDLIGDLATFEFEVEGEPTDFGTESIVYTLVENDINSGVFTTEVDMDDILDFANNGGPLDADEGDVLQVTYNDFMDDVAPESTDDMTIGKADTPDGDQTCMGLAATIVGTDGNDVLNGTQGVDVIVGLRGNDTISGLGGNDVICGGLGFDHLSGGDGNDMLFGGNRNDVLAGDAGNDLLWGGTGWDQLTGGSGNDTLRGGVGNDNLAGGDGDDRLFGQEGLDRLDGGGGSNTLVQD